MTDAGCLEERRGLSKCSQNVLEAFSRFPTGQERRRTKTSPNCSHFCPELALKNAPNLPGTLKDFSCFVHLANQEYPPPPRGAQILADPTKAMVDMLFLFFSRIWASTVDLGDPELDFALRQWW